MRCRPAAPTAARAWWARDKTTGAVVGSIDLPSGAIGTPMTYLYEGKQYIALTIGGDVPELIALALP